MGGTCCGSRKNLQAYGSVANSWKSQDRPQTPHYYMHVAVSNSKIYLRVVEKRATAQCTLTSLYVVHKHLPTHLLVSGWKPQNQNLCGSTAENNTRLPP